MTDLSTLPQAYINAFLLSITKPGESFAKAFDQHMNSEADHESHAE